MLFNVSDNITYCIINHSSVRSSTIHIVERNPGNMSRLLLNPSFSKRYNIKCYLLDDVLI